MSLFGMYLSCINENCAVSDSITLIYYFVDFLRCRDSIHYNLKKKSLYISKL